MSDQVIFTKEEANQIKEALRRHELSPDGHKWNDIREAISIIDSPRPMPKISLETIYGLLNATYGENLNVLEQSAIRYMNLCGFEVED